MDEVSERSTYSFTAWGRRFGRRVIDFLAPPKCLVCHDPVLEPASLCLSCWAHLRLIDAPVCNVLGIPFAYDQGEGAISPAALADRRSGTGRGRPLPMTRRRGGLFMG